MARDKAKDDKHFNCEQKHELDYVSGLYPNHEAEVLTLLIKWCKNNTIKYSTHKEVYELIKKELGYSIPN